MAEVQNEGSVVKESALKVESSPKLLVNGTECVVISDRDVHSNSSEEDDHKRIFHTDSENERRGTPEPFEPPSEELTEKIVTQVEQYLSDENLAKDAFLLKHVRRNKEGFVNLKLITSFKRVKSLTKDHRAVGEALKVSEKLSLNAEGTKVKRNSPLPAELLERNPGRTIVATKIGNPSFDSVSEMFSKCGEITLIRILRPGKPVPSDLKAYFSKNPEMEKEVCAVIEFETMAAAARACSELSKENGMHVVELGKAKKEKVKAKVKSKDRGSDTGKDSEDELEDRGRRRRNKKNKDKRLQEVMGSRSDGNHSSSCSSDTDSPYSSFSSCRRRYNSGGSGSEGHLTPGGTPRSSQPGSWRESRSPQSSPEPSRRRFADPSHKEGSSSAPSSPWSQRRKAASPNAHASGKSPLADSEPVRHKMVQLEGIQRLPKGPDGTRGFHSGFGRERTLLAVA